MKSDSYVVTLVIERDIKVLKLDLAEVKSGNQKVSRSNG